MAPHSSKTTERHGKTGQRRRQALALLLVLAGAGFGGAQLVAEPAPAGPAPGAGQQQQQQQSSASSASSSSSSGRAETALAKQARFKQYQQSALYVAPFEAGIIALPDMQLSFVRKIVAADLKLYREIVSEAIETRHKFAPSARLMLKYTGKLLGGFIRNRLADKQLAERVEPVPEYFSMLADMAQQVLERSGELKRARGYNKDSVDGQALRARVDALFDYCQRIINNSPLGGYMKWNTVRLFMDEPKNALYQADLVEEAADVVAQFRAMGFESCSFVVRRIVKLLRLFARGVLPSSEKDV